MGSLQHARNHAKYFTCILSLNFHSLYEAGAPTLAPCGRTRSNIHLCSFLHVTPHLVAMSTFYAHSPQRKGVPAEMQKKKFILSFQVYFWNSKKITGQKSCNFFFILTEKNYNKNPQSSTTLLPTLP